MMAAHCKSDRNPAGADPGPACYGNSGEEPTVTDAAVVLNRYSPDSALGGTLHVKPELAEAAIAKLADKVGMPIHDTRLGHHAPRQRKYG